MSEADEHLRLLFGRTVVKMLPCDVLEQTMEEDVLVDMELEEGDEVGWLIGILVQLADSGWRYLAAPQRLSYVPYSADRDTSQVHLDERFLHILSD